MTAHISLALAEQLDEVAARLERSRGWIMKRALADWVKTEDERYRLTLDALVQVDSDQVVDHATVQEWVDNLGSDEPPAESG
ncbi:MAG: CopG family ribbon-helix-helix protein [Rhodothermia bacterium]